MTNTLSSQARLLSSLLVFPLVVAGLLLPMGRVVSAGDTPSFNLTITQQAFQPDTLTIPAGKQVKLSVKNEDAIPAEFESYDFNSEKVLPGKSEIAIYVGPLKAGTYEFFNDFHQSAKGKLIVK